MKQVAIESINLSLPSDWSEVKLSQFLDFLEWRERRPEKFEYEYEDFLNSLELITIFSTPKITVDDMDSISLVDLKPLIDDFTSFIHNQPAFTQRNKITLNGVDYAFRDVSKLSIGEYVSYNKLLETSKNRLRSIPDLLSIICRPVVGVTFDKELGKDIYEIEKFDTGKLEFRRNIMLDAPAIELMASANFFLSGKTLQMKNSQDSGNQSLDPMVI